MEDFTGKEDLGETIDKTLLEFFDILTDLYHQQALLGQTMRAGFLNLSRARYSMGVKSVDISQIDETKLQALIKVGVGVQDTESPDCDTDLFSAIHSSDNSSGEEKIDQSVESHKLENQANTGLRKRNIKSEDKDDNVIDSVEEIHLEDLSLDDTASGEFEKSDKKDKKVTDPLRCFGVLVPDTLRQSQNEFKKCAELVVTVGNLRTKLEMLRTKYTRLLKLKKKNSLSCN